MCVFLVDDVGRWVANVNPVDVVGNTLGRIWEVISICSSITQDANIVRYRPSTRISFAFACKKRTCHTVEEIFTTVAQLHTPIGMAQFEMPQSFVMTPQFPVQTLHQ